jgi:hypothetical protein
MAVSARQQGAQVFEWRSSGADCWFWGLPYQDGNAVVRPECTQTQPPWFAQLERKLESGALDDAGLAPEQWLGCAFQAAVTLNATRVAHAFGHNSLAAATIAADDEPGSSSGGGGSPLTTDSAAAVATAEV